MLFFERTKRLAREFLQFKKFKQMSPALAVFVGIFLIPFALLFFIQLGFTFLACILFALFEAPIKYLHSISRDEVKDSRTAVQVIVYYFSWPILFAFYVFYALFTLMVFINYLETVLVGYIANLGGFRFHISPLEENISKNLEPNRQWQKNVAAAIFIGTVAPLDLIMSITILAQAASEDVSPLYYLPTYLPIFFGIYFIFTCIYVPIAFQDLKREREQEKPQVEQEEKSEE